MNVKFKYEEHMEYMLKTYSQWKVTGEGVWEVCEEELAEELRADLIGDMSFDSIAHAIRNYIWMTLDKDPDYIQFNEDDFKELVNCIKEYYEIYGEG